MKCDAANATECIRNGCCVGSPKGCYHAMDGKKKKKNLKCCLCLLKGLMTAFLVECTTDGQFVFEIRNSLPSVHVDTTKLYIYGHPECKPVFVDDKVAIFKFGKEKCGVRFYVSCVHSA